MLRSFGLFFMALLFVLCVGLAYCNRKSSLPERGLQCAKSGWNKNYDIKSNRRDRKGGAYDE